MTNNQLEAFRQLAERMNLSGVFQIIIRHPNGKKEIKAFDLPEDRAKSWVKYWPGSEIEKVDSLPDIRK
jgi:hypothetical protein